MSINEKLGASIKKHRLAKGMSQEILAQRIRYKHRSSISVFENGDRAITVDILLRISEALNVDVCELIKDIRK